MRIALIFIFFFKTFNLFAIEVKCNFEEVYQNGETQQGIFLIKKDKLVISPVPKSKIVLVFEKCFFIVFKKYLNFFFKWDELVFLNLWIYEPDCMS